jgi:hypothetical protein
VVENWFARSGSHKSYSQNLIDNTDVAGKVTFVAKFDGGCAPPTTQPVAGQDNVIASFNAYEAAITCLESVCKDYLSATPNVSSPHYACYGVTSAFEAVGTDGLFASVIDVSIDEECIKRDSDVAREVQAVLSNCHVDATLDSVSNSRACYDEAKDVAVAQLTFILGQGCDGFPLTTTSGGNSCYNVVEEEAALKTGIEAIAENITEFETLAAEFEHQTAQDAANKAVADAMAALAGRIAAGGEARNASLLEREAALSNALRDASTEALSIAQLNPDLTVPVEEAKAKSTLKKDEVADAETALADCQSNPPPNDLLCQGNERLLWMAQDALKAAKETEYILRKLQLQVLSLASEGGGLSPAQRVQLSEIIEEIAGELAALQSDLQAAQAVEASAQLAFTNGQYGFKCVTIHDEGFNCKSLGLTLEAAKGKVANLEGEVAAAQAALDDTNFSARYASSSTRPAAAVGKCTLIASVLLNLMIHH